MSFMQAKTPLEDCIDFILNNCSEKELDVVIAAVERKKKSLKGEFSFDTEAVSKHMAAQINTSIKKGIEGMTDSIRSFSKDLITKEAPGLSDAQVENLVDSWIPEFNNEKKISHNGKVNGIPQDLLYDMILQFVSFGLGEMEKSKDDALKAEIGNWQEKYWARFPKKIKQEIKTFFDGKKTYGDFDKSVRKLLDLN